MSKGDVQHLSKHQDTENKGQNTESEGRPTGRNRSLAQELAMGRSRAAVIFAGQGAGCLDELIELCDHHPFLRPWVERASEAISTLVREERDFRWSGLYPRGFDLSAWMADPAVRPEPEVLSSSTISQPLIFITQIMRFLALYREGLDQAFAAGAITAVTGHSQGMMPALLVGEAPAGEINQERFVEFVRYFTWQGLHMANSYRAISLPRANDPQSTAMASVAGPTSARLEAIVAKVNASLPEACPVAITLYNTRTRHVVSGAPASLEQLHGAIEKLSAREAAARREGRLGGAPLKAVWEYLSVGAAFHSVYMAQGLEAMLATVERIGFRVNAADLALPVISPDTSRPLNESQDLTRELVTSQFVRPVRWRRTVRAVEETGKPDYILDLGPSDGVARLTRSALKGSAVRVLALTRSDDRKTLFTVGAPRPARPIVYDDFAPRLVKLPNGQVAVDNRYTRATGQPPVILPGMTPTTSEVDIVAAAANAGFTAELAGGGQVTEAIFNTRMAELTEVLKPGHEIVFNSLYLDPYLWGLHLGRQRLVQKARRAGAPICGVTISAGIPEVDEAVALLDELRAEGIWLNAFKPGTRAQVERVIKIARAAAHHTIFVHLEGGKAGGHHSWEDLDELLLECYHMVRAQPNLVLCVGGGIADEARANELLTGQWAVAHGERSMPVDAVFLGTLLMACKEAHTSPQVKAALVKAAGCDAWVFNGKVDGGMTSGRSQLNADIHYLENAAARCGRVLDAVAGDAEAVEARRDEIIEALNATARPYFGDLHAMSYGQVLDRMVQLMAVGRGGRYEDGNWADRTWRLRVFDFAQRVEARLHTQDEGLFTPVLSGPCRWDEPAQAMAKLREAYPGIDSRILHPTDVTFFIRQICARPGKPVCFVPVIDADVRRWYKADSLWAAHDDRFEAHQVLVIPGPEALQGIKEADEPVADVLGRFAQALVGSLHTEGQVLMEADRLRGPISSVTMPEGIVGDTSPFRTILTARQALSQDAWFDFVSSRFRGAAPALFGAARIMIGGRGAPNPVLSLCRADAGATLRLDNRLDGVITNISYQLTPTEKVEVEMLEADRLALRVHTPGLGGQRGATLVLELQHVPEADAFVVDPKTRAEAIQSFYHQALFGRALETAPLFEAAVGKVTVEADRAAAYAAQTRASVSAGVPMNLAFTLAWEPIFRAISCDELAGGLLDLVHLEHSVEPLAGWPLVAGEDMDVRATIHRVEDAQTGRTVSARARLFRGQEPVADVVGQFFIRGDFGHTAHVVRSKQPFAAQLAIADDAAATFVTEHDFITWQAEVQAGDVLSIDAQVSEARPRQGDATFGATGRVLRGGEVIGQIALQSTEDAKMHPLEALAQILAPSEETTSRPRRRLAKDYDRTPELMDAFAEIGLDLNPIHRSRLTARLAGMDAPIVHGMWSAARLHAFLVQHVAQGLPKRVCSFKVAFMAPALCGEAVVMEAVRVGVDGGDMLVEATASVQRGEALVPVVRAEARIAAPTTAYIFPGQGIQSQGMGMAGYGRSRAARAVWDRADAFTRRALGFSILTVVRDNPRELLARGTSFVHPKGVLHLTQFTQVAMAVLAQAQVAELRESGALVEGAVTCGHSVGEYNALGAITGVLPLEDVVDIVYNRGLVMHKLVARDADGESGYRMGVIRPHYARMSHAQAEALVEAIRQKSGHFIQIVNYNVRGRQYSVTGQVAALDILQAELEARQTPGGKAPYIEVPGIDVPFHSEVLRGGVDSFRKTLDTRLPQVIDWQSLVGRYVPNLVPKPFSLGRPYIEEVNALTDGTVLGPILEDFQSWSERPVELSRALLIELLAWQFTSPVRWIESQELMLAQPHVGGLGVERIIEVGVGYQPTLANMARYTLRLMGLDEVEVYNAEAEAAVVFATDSDPEPEEVIVEDAGAGEAAQLAAPAAPVAVAAPAAPVTVAASVPDRPYSHREALRAILSLQARVRPEQIKDAETIDDLFDGVSSRRNQVLLDLGAEFDLGTIDGAHEKPLTDLDAEIKGRSPSYKVPGGYLRPAVDDALKKVFGRAGVGRKDITAKLAETYGLGDGLTASALTLLALESRDGESGRSGALGALADLRPGNRGEVEGAMDRWIATLAEQTGLPLGRKVAAAAGGGQVDAAAVRELESRLDDVLMGAAREVARALGHDLEAKAPGLPQVDEAAAKLAVVEAEHGPRHVEMISPRFDARRHVAFASTWATAQRDVAMLTFEAMAGRMDESEIARQAARLARFGKRTRQTAAWYASQVRAKGASQALIDALEQIASGQPASAAPMVPSRPSLSIGQTGEMVYEEVPQLEADAAARFVASLWDGQDKGLVTVGAGGQHDAAFRSVLEDGLTSPLPFAGKTALVTGASPGSIAVEVAAHLLRGGARVVVATSSCHRQRLAFYRKLAQEAAAPGAELHVVPFNQTSFQDTDALVDWLFDESIEQVGAEVKVIKRPFAPDIVVPFAALKTLGTLDAMDDKAEVAVRAMLMGTERLIARIAARYVRQGLPAEPCAVLLPLSPNHGTFGGDGPYAETKIALEVLSHKWRSESEAWGKAVTICNARIGWVRGTGLMDANNPVAARLEAQTEARTFSSAEMGWLLAALCSEPMRRLAQHAPLDADLTGRFGALGQVRQVVDGIRDGLANRSTAARQLDSLRQKEATLMGRTLNRAPRQLLALPDWPERQPTSVVDADAQGDPNLDLDRTIVIVGYGEVGPCGSSRTRFELEAEDRLSAAGVMELAWTVGLIRYQDGQWIDVESEEVVPEGEIAERYREGVRQRAGIRFVEPETLGFDPQRVPVFTTVYLEKDFSFPVANSDEARTFVAADPEHTRASYDADAETWRVTRLAGSEIKVPRQAKLSRRVAGLVPDGFDPARFGVSRDMVENVDPVSLFNLIATVDAFVSAGMDPEELMHWVHPARVACTQGSGIGGMRSLRRLYVDHIMDEERQSDVLQETLINVVAAYVVQSYLGSYGPMSQPVAACATAAVSLEEGVDKILVGKADFAVTGGFDDIGRAGMVGFADMNATCDTEKMLSMGMEPSQMSRSNDVRRRGFVEAQGGGTILVTRASVALEAGLPILGVVAYAGSFGDGIHKSIPAPGMGALASALGGARSPLGQALGALGLTTDDIGVVYKHDTSTGANDPNENELHDRIQNALGRTQGNPLWVVSQKTLTGHPKGGAAAWQLIGLCQSLQRGVIPGNRNLDSVDPRMESFGHMGFTDTTLRPGAAMPIKAGLVTSLGFGHVSGLALLAHPHVLIEKLDADTRATWTQAAANREAKRRSTRAAILTGARDAFTKRTDRRFEAADGTAEQATQEAAMLLDPSARMDLTTGVFATTNKDQS